MDGQTNKNSNSIINDCTYIKTMNILNTVSINKKKKKNLPEWSGTDVEKCRSQTSEIIYKLSQLELPFLVLMYSLGNIHITIKLP